MPKSGVADGSHWSSATLMPTLQGWLDPTDGLSSLVAAVFLVFSWQSLRRKRGWAQDFQPWRPRADGVRPLPLGLDGVGGPVPGGGRLSLKSAADLVHGLRLWLDFWAKTATPGESFQGLQPPKRRAPSR
jgi:hypothetical protein